MRRERRSDAAVKKGDASWGFGLEVRRLTDRRDRLWWQTAVLPNTVRILQASGIWKMKICMY